MLHHDSTGARQRIAPGAIGWMTAGRGIVHSERTPEDLRGVAHGMHGLQLWAARPTPRCRRARCERGTICRPAPPASPGMPGQDAMPGGSGRIDGSPVGRSPDGRQ